MFLSRPYQSHPPPPSSPPYPYLSHLPTLHSNPLGKSWIRDWNKIISLINLYKKVKTCKATTCRRDSERVHYGSKGWSLVIFVVWKYSSCRLARTSRETKNSSTQAKVRVNELFSKGKHTNGTFQNVRVILKFDLSVFELNGINCTYNKNGTSN